MASARPMHRFAALALVLWVMAFAQRARAQEPAEAVDDLSQYGDYDIHHDGWNGLSTFAAVAEGSGMQVVERSQIDWTEVDNDDLIFLLYPTHFVDPSDMLSFIRNGGRVLLADDFGASSSALTRLGGQRIETDVQTARYHDSHAFAPIAHPVIDHPLSRGVTELTTNHPAVLRELRGMTSVFEFDDGSTVVAAGSRGAGRYVALADPSVLINRMLEFEGNLQFAINLLRFLSKPAPVQRIIVLTGSVDFYNHPRNSFDDGTWRGRASAVVNQLNALGDELNEYLLMPTTLRILGISLALAVATLAFMALPMSRSRRFDGEWTRAGPGNAAHGPEHMIRQYEHLGARQSFLLPAAIARDNINLALEDSLEVPEPLYNLAGQTLLARVRDVHGAESAQILQPLLPKLRTLPQRAQAAAHWQPRFLGRSEFQAIHASAERFFASLESSRDEV